MYDSSYGFAPPPMEMPLFINTSNGPHAAISFPGEYLYGGFGSKVNVILDDTPDKEPTKKRRKKNAKDTNDLPPPDLFTCTDDYKDALVSLDSTEFDKYVQQLGKLNKINSDDHNILKDMRRRIKNRESARKSRESRRNKMDSLEDKVKELTNETNGLEREVACLEKEKELMLSEKSYLPKPL
eukprot:TRINITY_DN3336_c0_g1_i2.p1 TRINITY_DN3336_c0_g1~~TRINITY_DN3336_c0_g1_i2.p1  ORF type:complete len:211 (+),score=59.23 TRINITY_DN3336_c0_g1_i2:86-634(+)